MAARTGGGGVNFRSSLDGRSDRESLEQGGCVNDDLLGWATKPLIRLDDVSPGLIRCVVTSSAMVRQAIFLTLAHPMEPSGTLLRDGRAKDIILGHFGELPNGLLGALSRMPRTLPSVPLYRSF
jgi:hypothetical protein